MWKQLVPQLVLLLILVLPASAQAQVFSEFDGTEVLNPGFESIGFDLGDGLRSASFWEGASSLSALAFEGRDGVFTGSGSYMRVIAEGSATNPTFQEIVGGVVAGYTYTWSATAYASPETAAGQVDYAVTMRLYFIALEVPEGSTSAAAAGAPPVLFDEQTVVLQPGEIAPVSVSFVSDDQIIATLRIEFEAAPVAAGTFTRGGVDDVVQGEPIAPPPAPVPGLGYVQLGVLAALLAALGAHRGLRHRTG